MNVDIVDKYCTDDNNPIKKNLRLKLKMFLKILAISVAHRKIDQFNISDHLKKNIGTPPCNKVPLPFY